ncbi:stemmadenine O-acetyltransferase-like [Mercurialis annua]|uniref:stemmadenine O-acetyltransferase-like n=1 Tax=Mercurialis annua TaxID=3986 RepID=UPI0024ACDB8B|nr:stemmadenine O-acetyltransferase-like [Mercurialis annua]
MKMKLEVDFISQELIKPLSPTPEHLRRLHLSFLDQVQSPVCMPIVLFYSKNSNSERCIVLKKSLSKALTMFYPLAGRINNDTFIDCNDEGVLFVEAQVNCQLSDILPNYNPSDSNKLIPLQPDQGKDLVSFFQVTFFKCGGFCISFSLLHKLGDALSQFQFLNSWAAITRGDHSDNISIPIFGTAKLFPPLKLHSGFDNGELLGNDEKIVTKRFVFDASTIAAFQAKFGHEIGYTSSRVIALVAVLWSRFRAVIQTKKTDSNYIWTLTNYVNFRPRAEPPFSEMYFGNFITTAFVQVNIKDRSADEKYNDDARVVSQIRDVLRSVDKKYVENLQKTDVVFNLRQEEVRKLVNGEVIDFFCTSLCKMRIYEADFGWGKPVFVGSAHLPFNNGVSLFDTKDGGGIEAWITLKEEDMAKLEVDKEFLAYVNSSTHPFKLNANSRI